MNRKKDELEAMESSSEEAEEDEEADKDEDSASESTSDDDEFDSSDERVNMVLNETPSKTLKSFAQEESSEDSEFDEEEEPIKPSMKPAESEKIQGIKSFESDVESEYESESSSESEGLTQKTVVKESSIESVPPVQKKAKKDVVSVNQGTGEDDHFVKKGKAKELKKQQEPKPIKNPEEANPLISKGQGGAAKQTLKDSEQSQSVKDEKKEALSAKKRKLESIRHDGETDSADSVPLLKRRKEVAAAQNGKVNVDRDKPAHTSSDTGKEIAKKTLSDPSAKFNGSKDVSNKVSTVDHEPRQQKKASTDASNLPPSPQKQKKSPHVWSTDEEITMASEVLNHVRMGLEVPSKRNDDFWLTLSEVLHEKLGIEFSRDQLSEKLRRMKQRYQSTEQKIKETHDSHKPYKHKNDKEQNLFDIWSQIWGKAEVMTLEDHPAASDVKKEPSKSLAVSASVVKEGKNSTNTPKVRPASLKAKASKESTVAAVESNIGIDALPLEGITIVPMGLDKPEAVKEDSSAPDESASLSKDMHKLLQDKIHKTLDELQKWSKDSMEAWMSKALALIENSVKTLGDQARCMNAMGIAGRGLPMGLCDSMEFQFMHGEQAFQQQWYELHLQELNIYSQRLELMQKECKLKQEQLKLQLQLERGK